MNSPDFTDIPGRVFLDTCVVNLILDYGPQIHDAAAIGDAPRERRRRDMDALRWMFATGQRAMWQLAISPLTYQEVTATKDPARCYELERWFAEIWNYWQKILHGATDLPTFAEAETIRIATLASGQLDILPDVEDRVLICDALVYRCDAFCTCDWRTILRFRDSLQGLPLKIFTPAEWWAIVQPLAGIWA